MIARLLLFVAVAATVLMIVGAINELFMPANNSANQVSIAQAQAQQAQSNAMQAQAQAAEADAKADALEVLDETIAIIFLGGSNWILLIGGFTLALVWIVTRGDPR